MVCSCRAVKDVSDQTVVGRFKVSKTAAVLVQSVEFDYRPECSKYCLRGVSMGFQLFSAFLYSFSLTDGVYFLKKSCILPIQTSTPSPYY